MPLGAGHQPQQQGARIPSKPHLGEGPTLLVLTAQAHLKGTAGAIGLAQTQLKRGAIRCGAEGHVRGKLDGCGQRSRIHGAAVAQFQHCRCIHGRPHRQQTARAPLETVLLDQRQEETCKQQAPGETMDLVARQWAGQGQRRRNGQGLDMTLSPTGAALAHTA